MANKVLLVGQRHLFLAGLERILDELQFQIAASVETLSDIDTTASGETLVIVDKPEAVEEIEADLASFKVAAPQARLVVIADAFDESEMTRAFAAGAHGYLLADISPEALRESLNLVMLGESVFPSQLVASLCNRAWARSAGPEAADADLSDREAEIVARLAEGMPNKVIASELTITEATVKVHLKSILRKLGVTNRTQAAVWAISRGLRSDPQLMQ